MLGEFQVSAESECKGSEPDELIDCDDRTESVPLSFSLPEWFEPSPSVFFANRPPVPLALLIACWCLDSWRYGCVHQMSAYSPIEDPKTLRRTLVIVEPNSVQCLWACYALSNTESRLADKWTKLLKQLGDIKVDNRIDPRVIHTQKKAIKPRNSTISLLKKTEYCPKMDLHGEMDLNMRRKLIRSAIAPVGTFSSFKTQTNF